MATRLRGNRSRGVAPRRTTDWLARVFNSSVNTLGANAFVLDSSLSTAEKAMRPFTVVRTIGTLYVASDQGAATESPNGAMGMQVVSEKAVTTGVTALPEPVSEAPSDLWFVYREFATQIRVATAVGFDTRAFSAFPFDSKAMRKVNNEEDVAIMVGNAASAHALVYLLQFRMLIKLH